MLLTKPVHDACLVEIIGGYLKFDEIARGKADEPLPHLSRDVGEYEMFISKRDPKHGSGQHGDNLSFRFQSDAPLAIRGAVRALTHSPGQVPTPRYLRAVLNAIFYLLRTGCQWRLLPREFPRPGTVYHYFRAWKDAG
jgi:Putative transposase of IS4/5 family (DUF4096)